MINNATKSQWLPEEIDGTAQILEGDLFGKGIGRYADMGTACYSARLHNNHVSGSDVLREVDRMFQSEIHFGIRAQWDAGIAWYLGWDADSAISTGSGATIEEALIGLVNAGRANFPDSVFARLFQGDLVVDPDQRSDETLVRELAESGEVSMWFDPSRDHEHSSWVVEIGGRAFSGSTQREALLAALAPE